MVLILQLRGLDLLKLLRQSRHGDCGPQVEERKLCGGDLVWR